MISQRALTQTMGKLRRLSGMLYQRMFTPVDSVLVTLYQTTETLHAVPEAALFGPLPGDMRWGGEGVYGWFRGGYTVPEALAEKPLFLYPKIGGYEGTLWVNGQIQDNFAMKEIVGSHGNHYAKRITGGAPAGTKFDLAIEYYAYHRMPGTQPLRDEAKKTFVYPIGPVDVCERNELYLACWADLTTLLGLIETLPESSFRRADVANTLFRAHALLYYDPDNAPDGAFDAALREIAPLLADQLSKTNGASAPFVGLIGHSHMDTAWLWPMRETVKKCARTYAGQLQLLAQYPEYLFVQSSAYHLEMMRAHYPALFARIGDAVRVGRWEPNGAVWVECDCNLTGGEYMVRQFLWGQRFTERHFGYRSDTFWLPDTFGYSYAIPQIMQGSGVKYFLTTKMAWNDTTRFPYTTFLWQGIDGTRVLTHLNRTHLGPDPALLSALTGGGGPVDDPILEKPVSGMRLLSYGKGDGGGGPEFEMVEMSRRLGDLEGLPRSAHTTVSRFMQTLETTARDPSVYAGELYLELHRGTLTNQHNIKRNNRKAEIALRALEWATVQRAVSTGDVADGADIAPLMNDLLVNQFHDILPGTCIHSVHALSLEQTGRVITEANASTAALLTGDKTDGSAVTLYNDLSFAREDTVYLPRKPGHRIAGSYAQQRFTDLNGQETLAVQGVCLPALGSATLRWEPGEPEAAGGPFTFDGDTLTTVHARITFDQNGMIASYVDLALGRELRAAGGEPLGTFLMAEDVSTSWDNWDIDADLEVKLRPAATLLSREVIASGPVELRIRSRYRISDRSEIVQDMILPATSPAIVYDTVIDWHDKHRFLKVAFDTALVADSARHEIQFGFIRRANHRSTDVEKARFEVCNHKYTDLSETGYGIALLNDCKYGISVKEGSMRLSLHKGGILPDEQGDMGRHTCRYAFLPHAEGFGAQAVIHPAYRLNHPPILANGASKAVPLLTVENAPSVLIEAIKPCEDADTAYIVRLYESAGAYANARISIAHAATNLSLTNLLEETIQPLSTAHDIALPFKPFEIKTLRVGYPGR